MADPGVCLIGGCGSSGTTLLAHLLDGIHDVRCSPEAYVFNHRLLYRESDFPRELYRALAQLSPKWQYQVEGWSFPLIPPIFLSAREFFGVETIYEEYDLFARSPSFESMVGFMKEKMATIHPFPEDFMWVDQTPRNVYGAVGFLDRFPEGKFIHLIRDGRDVIASLAKRYALEYPGKPRKTYLLAGACRWCLDVTHGLRARGRPGYLEVRYEALTAAPLQWINAILDHLGRPAIDEAVLRAKKSYAAENYPKLFLGGDKPSWDANPTESVNTRSVGRWRRDLEAEEVDDLLGRSFELGHEKANVSLNKLLRELGYFEGDGSALLSL